MTTAGMTATLSRVILPASLSFWRRRSFCSSRMQLGILDLFLAQLADFRLLLGREIQFAAARFLRLEFAEFLLGLLLLLPRTPRSSLPTCLLKSASIFWTTVKGRRTAAREREPIRCFEPTAWSSRLKSSEELPLIGRGHLHAAEVLHVVGEAVVEGVHVGDEEDVARRWRLPSAMWVWLLLLLVRLVVGPSSAVPSLSSGRLRLSRPACHRGRRS